MMQCVLLCEGLVSPKSVQSGKYQSERNKNGFCTKNENGSCTGRKNGAREVSLYICGISFCFNLV